MRSSWEKVFLTSQTNYQPFPTQKWRNRPGRDLLIALLVSYAALAVPVLLVTQDVSGFVTAGLIYGMVPVGLILAIMKADLIAAVGLALVLGVMAVFILRMPGLVRVPVLLAMFAASYYCTLVSGTVLN